jgi:hypothetical protein
MTEESKKEALKCFLELDRRGLIGHDWSEVHETGRVKSPHQTRRGEATFRKQVLKTISST